MNSRRYNLEMCGDVAAEHTRLQRLHMTTDVGFRCHEMAFEHSPVRFLVSIRHDHISPVGFNLRQLSNVVRDEGGDEP